MNDSHKTTYSIGLGQYSKSFLLINKIGGFYKVEYRRFNRKEELKEINIKYNLTYEDMIKNYGKLKDFNNLPKHLLDFYIDDNYSIEEYLKDCRLIEEKEKQENLRRYYN